MQENNQVEIDTDDVQDENIAVAEKPKEEKAEVAEVDLGYTDHDKKVETKSEVVEKPEQPTDNLQEHSTNVQKRIDQLTRRMREAERREKEAIKYAKGLQTHYDVQSKKVNTEFTKQYEQRVDSEREKVKAELKEAVEIQDTAKMMDLTEKLTQLAVQKEKASSALQKDVQQETKEPEAPQQEEPLNPAIANIPPPSAKAEAWGQKNPWFGVDDVMTDASFKIHKKLVGEGFDPESDEYYNEIDKQMSTYFPSKMKGEQPVQQVASAGRKQQGRRTVKLTRTQVAIAKRLGVPLEEYAKYVKE
jgi:hypothetical protein